MIMRGHFVTVFHMIRVGWGNWSQNNLPYGEPAYMYVLYGIS